MPKGVYERTEGSKIYNKIPVSERFWGKVEKTDYCWEWTGSTTDGYGMIKGENGKNILTHRWSYIEKYKDIPDGLIIRHKCDNRLCVNPDHLETGTHQDNSNDKLSRDRQSCGYGERNSHAVITEVQALEIISKWKSGKYKFKRQLGNEYNLSDSAISALLTGRSWKHLSV